MPVLLMRQSYLNPNLNPNLNLSNEPLSFFRLP
jgi:hypothetical protein